MGTKISSFAASQFILKYEFNYLLITNKNFRDIKYIDDLIHFNDNILISINDIYPPCKKLIKSSDECFHVIFWISIEKLQILEYK